jgi:hypothetical protein
MPETQLQIAADTRSREQDKAKEKWLRQELRVNRTQMFGLLQWGVTVLAAAELNLYYIRRDVTKHLVELNALKPDELLPFARWAVGGTGLLIILATVFSMYMKRAVDRHVLYRQQLMDMSPNYSGINEIPKSGKGLRAGGSLLSSLHYLLFFIFPLFDVFLWIVFTARKYFQINF